jgi:pimeloyl-ACP methyl ester carboxylesterase
MPADDLTATWHETGTSAGPLRYRDLGAGEPLLFVHGVLSSSTLWQPILAPLAGVGRCVVPDWPLGSHNVPMNPDADLSPPGLAALIVEVCDRLGLDEVTLVGNDTGGALCQLVAAFHPERVRRLILTPCDAYDNFPPSKVFWLLNLAARTPGGLRVTGQVMRVRALWRLPVTFGHLLKHRPDPTVISGWFDPLRRHAGVRRDLAKVIRTLDSRHTVDAAERLRSFTRPALLAWATEDRVFPFEHARRLAGAIPNARLEAIDDSYSFVSLDQPGRTAELIATFVKETP